MEKIGNIGTPLTPTASGTSKFGITMVENSEWIKYNLKSGLIGARLIDIQDARRELFESRINKDINKVPAYEPIFKFIYETKDLEGQLVQLSREVTKKISFLSPRNTKGKESNLYKDLYALLPNEPRTAFQTPEGADIVISSILNACSEKLYPKVYLQIERKESGYISIKAVLPVPESALTKQVKADDKAKREELTIETDDIPF